MLGSAAISFMQQKLAWTTGRSTEILSALQSAQILLEQGDVLPWFLITEDDSQAVAADATSFALPADFIREIRESRESGIYYLDGDSKPQYLKKLGWKELQTTYAAVAADVAKAYAIRYSTIEFRPAVAAATTFYWDYYASDAVVATGAENLWLKHAPFYLIGEAGILIAQDLGLEYSLKSFQMLSVAGRQKIITENALRFDSGRDYVAGRLRP